jgi:uncharacterized protein
MNRSGIAGAKDPARTATAALPKPVVDEDSVNFWNGVRRHELRLQRCLVCGEVRFPPMPHCPNCGSRDTASEQAGLSGTVYSWITVNRAMSGLLLDDVPCTFLAVDLAVGCRMIGRFTGAWAGSIGDRVVAVFVDHRDWTELRFQAAHPGPAGS